MAQGQRRVTEFTMQRIYPKANTGFSSTDISSAVDGTAIDCEGFNQLTILFDYTQSAGTGFQANLALIGSVDADQYVGQFSEDSGSGTETLNDRLITKASAASGKYAYNRPINCRKVQLLNMVATGAPDASDTMSVEIILGRL